MFFSIGSQISLSAYYNTSMRDISTGLMFVLSGFLWSYRGYDRRDEIAGKLVSIFGWLSAIFPLPQDPAKLGSLGLLHNALDGVFFIIILIYFASFLFTKSHPGQPPTPQKLRRNRGYRVCAIVMGAVPLCAYQTSFLGRDVGIRSIWDRLVRQGRRYTEG